MCIRMTCGIYRNKLALSELAAYMMTVFTTEEAVPDTALGYDSSRKAIKDDHVKALIDSGKLKPVDGSKWLFHHEAMVHPSADVMKYLYQNAIMGGSKAMKFGLYDLSQFQGDTDASN